MRSLADDARYRLCASSLASFCVTSLRRDSSRMAPPATATARIVISASAVKILRAIGRLVNSLIPRDPLVASDTHTPADMSQLINNTSYPAVLPGRATAPASGGNGGLARSRQVERADLDLVATAGLGGIERLIGAIDQLLEPGARHEARDPDA